jgi:hypothetical protein
MRAKIQESTLAIFSKRAKNIRESLGVSAYALRLAGVWSSFQANALKNKR